jgi:hypothetical protein
MATQGDFLMRPFRVGDALRGNHCGKTVEVIWVDPHDHFRAVMDYEETSVFAAQFLNHWTVMKEGPKPAWAA